MWDLELHHPTLPVQWWSQRVQPRKQKLSMQAVHDILKAHHVLDVDRVSRCLKAGILHGTVKLLLPQDDPDNEHGLDQVWC